MMRNAPVIITAALSGSGTFKHMNEAVPYTPEEFAEEAAKCFKSGAAMVHIHARTDQGLPTHEVERVRATYEAIKERTPELIVNLSSAVGGGKTPEQRITQIVDVKPEMASLNTNSMNFGLISKQDGRIIGEVVFENTFQMIVDFNNAMEKAGVKPEFEIYDIGGLDNILLLMKQGLFSVPMNFNFVWGVNGGQRLRPTAFEMLVNLLPPNSLFTTCGVSEMEFSAAMQSLILGGHVRVGLEDNMRMPNGEKAKGNYELVEWAVKTAEQLGRVPAMPDEARVLMGIRHR